VLDGFHPSGLVRTKAVGLSIRATGTLPIIAQSPECCWTTVWLGMNADRKRFGHHALMRAKDGSHPVYARVARKP
jgi:hypothetical protein